MGTGAGTGLNFGNTKGARSFYAGDVSFMSKDDRFLLGIQKRKDVDVNGFFDVIAHGTDNGMQITHNNKNLIVDSRTAAKLIQNKAGYTNQAIRLLSCNTGKLDTGFAQNLANKLNVKVYAPTKYLWADSGGNYFVAGMKSTGKPDYSDKGSFRVFYPNRRKYHGR